MESRPLWHGMDPQRANPYGAGPAPSAPRLRNRAKDDAKFYGAWAAFDDAMKDASPGKRLLQSAREAQELERMFRL